MLGIYSTWFYARFPQANSFLEVGDKSPNSEGNWCLFMWGTKDVIWGKRRCVAYTWEIFSRLNIWACLRLTVLQCEMFLQEMTSACSQWESKEVGYVSPTILSFFPPYSSGFFFFFAANKGTFHLHSQPTTIFNLKEVQSCAKIPLTRDLAYFFVSLLVHEFWSYFLVKYFVMCDPQSLNRSIMCKPQQLHDASCIVWKEPRANDLMKIV